MTLNHLRTGSQHLRLSTKTAVYSICKEFSEISTRFWKLRKFLTWTACEPVQKISICKVLITFKQKFKAVFLDYSKELIAWEHKRVLMLNHILNHFLNHSWTGLTFICWLQHQFSRNHKSFLELFLRYVNALFSHAEPLLEPLTEPLPEPLLDWFNLYMLTNSSV